MLEQTSTADQNKDATSHATSIRPSTRASTTSSHRLLQRGRDLRTIHSPRAGNSAAGSQAMTDFMIATKKAFPDFHFTVETIWGEGHTAAWRGLADGTHSSGSFPGPPALDGSQDPRPDGVRSCSPRNGKVKQMWVFTDSASGWLPRSARSGRDPRHRDDRKPARPNDLEPEQGGSVDAFRRGDAHGRTATAARWTAKFVRSQLVETERAVIIVDVQLAAEVRARASCACRRTRQADRARHHQPSGTRITGSGSKSFAGRDRRGLSRTSSGQLEAMGDLGGSAFASPSPATRSSTRRSSRPMSSARAS